MKYAIISAEIVCSIMMLIVGYAIFTEKRKALSHKFFACCIVCVLLTLVNDSLSYILESIHAPQIHIYITNLLAIVVGNILMMFFAFYVCALVNEKSKNNLFSKPFITIVCVVSIFDFIFEIYGAISGLTFSIVDSTFIVGDLYNIFFYVQLFLLAICLVYLIINIKVIGFGTLSVFIIYYLFPVISMIMIIINPDLSFIASSIAISFLVIYIGIEKEMEQRDAVITKLLNTDIMTNLLNRNAYEEMIKKCKELTDNNMIGIIFCDLNKLKAVNDQQGHEAGDQYIIKFSKILMECFPKQKIYRISGDEFIVLLEGVLQSYVEGKYKKLVNAIEKENYIASCGMNMGLANDISNIIKKAEHNMYIEKQVYYNKFGFKR